jgi:L-threonylcarbamoyladenylate synthase
LETIGVRMPKNLLAREFLKACETPLAAPSANLSGQPSPTPWQAVFEDLNERIDCILQGEMTEIGLESTVVDCTSKTPLILRTGAIGLEELRKIVPETGIYTIKEDEAVKSPGLKHKHYAPKAKVRLVQSSKFKVQSSKLKAFIGLNAPEIDFDLTKICATVEDYAHSVFAFFRLCDAENIETIYCQTVEETGIGLALMDRLKRAAELNEK